MLLVESLSLKRGYSPLCSSPDHPYLMTGSHGGMKVWVSYCNLDQLCKALLTNGLQPQFRLHVRFYNGFTSASILSFLLFHLFHCRLQEPLQISLLHVSLARFSGNPTRHSLLHISAQSLNFTADRTIILGRCETELKSVPYLLNNVE